MENIPEINLKLEEVIVKAEVRPLRVSWKRCLTRKEWFGRLPRKLKKKIKKEIGEDRFNFWWDNPFDMFSEKPLLDYKNAGSFKELADSIEKGLEKAIAEEIQKQK